MKQILTDNDRRLLDKSSDSYAEIPWKAFAFWASIASLVAIVMDLFVLHWLTETLILFSVTVILAAGAIFALLSVLFPRFATLFLSPLRKETEK